MSCVPFTSSYLLEYQRWYRLAKLSIRDCAVFTRGQARERAPVNRLGLLSGAPRDAQVPSWGEAPRAGVFAGASP